MRPVLVQLRRQTNQVSYKHECAHGNKSSYADGEQSPKKMNPLGAEVEAAHLFRSRSYLLPACGRGFRHRPPSSLIGFNTMCQENAGAEECNKRSNQLKHRSRLYISLRAHCAEVDRSFPFQV